MKWCQVFNTLQDTEKLQTGEALPYGELRNPFGECKMPVNKSTVNSNVS